MIKLKHLVLLVFFGLLLPACADYEQEIPTLIRQLNSSDRSVRNKAALRLGRIGSPHADRAVPRLITLLYDDNVGVQSSAAYALRRIDTPQAKEALERATKSRRRR